MESLLWLILLPPFLYINYKIIKTDIKEKKIPNIYLKHLLILLPIWYLYITCFNIFWDIELFSFIIQIFLTLFVSFCIFHFWLWWAWDAKYLLVLSLYIPHIWIIPYIGNIAYITLLFLLLYFIWFWIWPNLWNKNKRQSIYSNLWKVKKEKLIIENRHKSYFQIIKEVSKLLNIFFLIFISLRLIRIHILDYIYTKYGITFVDIIFHPYGIYMLLWFFGIIILISLWIRYLISFCKDLTANTNPVIFLFLINIVWIMYFSYEYIRNPDSFINNIVLIFSLYIFIYLFFKLLLFAYKLVFIMQEESLLHINQLKEWMIIDKNFLRKSFKWQKKIFTSSEIWGLETSIDKETIDFLHKKYKQVNTYIKKHTPEEQYSPFESIQIKKTFAFGTFIYMGFIVSVIFYLQDFNLIRFLVSLL